MQVLEFQGEFAVIFENDERVWAMQVFGGCDLGDSRRGRRLVDFGARLAKDPSGALTRICRGDKAAMEGAYKFVENDAVRPEAIADGIFASTAKFAKNTKVCLAIQDTTTVDISDYLKDGWKEMGSPAGYQVHSTLLVDGASATPIGLVDQARWLRPHKSVRKTKAEKAARTAKEKESHKWALGLEGTARRLSSMENVITVCDREADIYDFLHTMDQQEFRYVVRAKHNRKIKSSDARLFEKVSNSQTLGQYTVQIGQRGEQRAQKGQKSRPSRKSRKAIAEIRAVQVELPATIKATQKHPAPPVVTNIVLVEEPCPPTGIEGIRWLLLTSEPIATIAQVLNIVKYYSQRWLIEEFHKAWKTGCNLEQRRLQSYDNFERMMVVTAAIGVRILQLRTLGQGAEVTCDTILDTDEWQCLYANTNPGEPLPKEVPTVKWAYYAIAKLVGWSDSKRTGRVGWQTLWEGWQRLELLLQGWRIALQMKGL